jgi:predicted ATPase/DNA-binding SARP family transcriptional activator/tetratricopeptide (TPR) repeat protein
LCVYLACRPERHRRESLMGLLWPDWPPSSAQQNLRQALYTLRQKLPAVASRDGSLPVPLILAERDSLQVNPNANVTVDALRFTSLLEQPQPTPAQLAEAVALYRGDFLADFYLPDSEPFEEWVAAWRADLRRRMLEALGSLAAGALEQGEYGEAMAYARRQLELDNLRESAHRQLMLALAYSGQRASALAHYKDCRRLMRRELNVEPSAETRALAEQIAFDEEAWGGAAVEVRRSSTHRPPVRHNLPLQLSSFIGRERELAEVRRFLESSRLVTLTGAGGSGKTRLALRVAGDLLDVFKDGIWLVELAPLADSALVPSAIASSLGIAENEGGPLLDTLVGYLRDRHLLLLLDNCEHLVAEVARLADALLRHCPRLRVLATSREPLGIAGETVWLAPTLSLPPPDAQLSVDNLTQYDAIKLFVERATAALPSFALTESNAAAVAQLCRQLDAIPLAIELAAARVGLLRVEQIVARLGNRLSFLVGGHGAAPRHQTLQALIDWSHALLSPQERRLLRRLSIFAGGFTLEATETICDEENTGDTLELLAKLVKKSLVVVDRATGREARYSLHETIRQYAWAHLEDMGEATEILERQAAYYCRVLESTLPRFFYNDLVILNRDWLEAEMENMRAVMGRSLDDRAISAEWGIRIAVRLAGYWVVYSRLEEASRWLEAAAEREREATPMVRAILCTRLAGFVARDSRQFGADKVEESLAIFRQLGDGEGIVCSTFLLAMNYWDPERAIAELEKIIPLAIETGPESLSRVHYGLSWRAGMARDFPQAIAWGEQFLNFLRGFPFGRTILAEKLRVIGAYYRFAGDYKRATSLMQEGLEIAHSLDIGEAIIAYTLNALGENYRLQKDYDRADDYYRQALSMASKKGYEFLWALLLSNVALCQIARGDVVGAKETYREILVILRRGEQLNLLLTKLDLWILAQLAELVGEAERAALLHGAAESMRVLLGQATTMVGPGDIEDIADNVARVRARLGEEAYAAAWAEGQRLSPDEVIAVVEELVADNEKQPGR